MIVVEEYFRRGVTKGDLSRRIGRVYVPIMALIFLADLTLAFLVGFPALPAVRWLLLALELASIFGLVVLARRSVDQRKPGSTRKIE
jgi:hypothetical protein